MAKVPHSSTSERGRPLQEAVDRVAYGANLSHRQAAIAVSHFLEAMAMLVARGEYFAIDGFGVFVSQRKKKGTKRKYVAFSASRGFRNEIEFGAEPKPEHTKMLHNHQRNANRLGEKGASKRVHTSMQAQRVAIEAQHAYAYVEEDDDDD